MNYQKSYIGKILNALSQLGNAVIGGNPDISISARIGFNSSHKASKFWTVAEWVVDKAFYPVDGLGHCYQAFQNDINENYSQSISSLIPLVGMTLLLILVCIPLGIIFWTYHLLKKFLRLFKKKG